MHLIKEMITLQLEHMDAVDYLSKSRVLQPVQGAPSGQAFFVRSNPSINLFSHFPLIASECVAVFPPSEDFASLFSRPAYSANV